MSEYYNLMGLKRGLLSVENNIAQLEIALVKEKYKKDQYDKLIMIAEVMLETDANSTDDKETAIQIARQING